MHSGAVLSAVYYYFRALAVAEPFAVSRQNVRTVFMQNEDAYKALRRPAGNSQPVGALLAALSTRFVRLHGKSGEALASFPQVTCIMSTKSTSLPVRTTIWHNDVIPAEKARSSQQKAPFDTYGCMVRTCSV